MADRTAIYLRVSTSEQTTENQRLDLEKLCDLRGWTVVGVYEDAGISGAKGREERPALASLLKDAKKRRFDRVVFWAVDRLGRSTAHVATIMEELDAVGVSQFYFKESIDTSTPHGQAMLEMAAVFAKLERSMIRERVKAGLTRAREKGTKSGKAIGRPPASSATQDRIRELLAAGKGLREVARELDVSVGLVHKVKNAASAA